THDGDHRRARDQVVLVALVFPEGEVEGVEQLAVLVLRADHLDRVAELGAEQLQRLVADRLRRRHHLTEVEQHLDQGRRVGVDPVGEVGQRGAAGQPDHVAVAARDLHAADGRSRHVVELLPPLLLALASADRTTAATRTAGTAGATAGTAAEAATSPGTTARGTGTSAGAARTRTPGRAAGH